MPTVPGTYTLKFDMVREGHAWFSGQGVQMPQSAVKVELPPYGATYEPAVTTVTGTAGTTVAVPVKVTNTGLLAWAPIEFALGYHLYVASGATYVWDGARTSVGATLPNGASATYNAAIRVPTAPGTYTLKFDMVREGVTWFSGQAVPMPSVTLTVQ